MKEKSGFHFISFEFLRINFTISVLKNRDIYTPNILNQVSLSIRYILIRVLIQILSIQEVCRKLCLLLAGAPRPSPSPFPEW